MKKQILYSFLSPWYLIFVQAKTMHLGIILKYNTFDYFIYLGFNIALNTIQVISRRVVLWAEETSTYSWSRFCTVNCWQMVSNYQLSHIGSGVWTPDLRDAIRVCYHCTTMAIYLIIDLLVLLLLVTSDYKRCTPKDYVVCLYNETGTTHLF